MAIKGVTWIEQHFEKIVLAAVSATALGILGWQFVGRQSTITLNNKQVALDQANAELKSKALDIQSKIKATDPKMPEHFPVTAIATDFQKRHNAPVTKARTLAWDPAPQVMFGDRQREVAGAAGDSVTNPLVVPVPAAPIAESYLATMVKAQLEVDAVVPETVTEADLVDVAYVTVETVFDGPALLAALTLDPDGPARPMPEHWWSGQIALLGIQLERQEMQDNGAWGPSVMVGASKFGATVLEQASDPALTGAQLRDLSKLATDRPDFARRPQPPSPFIGDEWASPSEIGTGRPNVAEQARLRKEIDGLEDRIKKIDEQIKRTPGDNKSALDRLNNQKRPLVTEYNEKVAKYNELMTPKGEKAETPPGTPTPPTPPNANRPRPVGKGGSTAPGAPAAPAVEPLLGTSGIRVWAHDTDVKRNRAYRYRVRAVVSNPMFNQGAGLPPSQRDLAKSALAMSEPTEWTQPVRVDPEIYYFVTSADDNKGNGVAAILTQEPSATAEVFSFKLGYWRTDQVRLHPGDPLVAEIPVPTLEQIRVAMDGNGNAPAAIDPIPDRREARRPEPPSGGAGSGGSGKTAGGGRVAPNANRPERPAGGGAAEPVRVEPKAAPGQPQAKPMLVPVSLPVYLLDVAPAPAAGGGGGDRFQAFFRADDGTIEVRVPDEDRQQKIYQRVRLSSESASLGGIRKIEARKDVPPPPPGGGQEKPPAGPGGG